MSCSCVNVILSLRRIRHSDGRNEKLDRSFVACPARSEPASGAHEPALREASLRAEPTGLPCAKRACERSPRACPARSEPASGAHGYLPQDDTQSSRGRTKALIERAIGSARGALRPATRDWRLR